jgi:glycosyltransferase involved in cell wall biosynthesis
MKGSISVVVPVYNAELYLKQCLDSVFAQTLVPQEVIVINDGSTDGSLGILKNYPKPIRLYSRENRGVSATINEAIGYVRGDYVALIDNDDYWQPDKLQRQAHFMHQNPQLDACFGLIKQFVSPEIASQKRFVVPSNPQKGLCKTTMLIRSDAFEKAGPFDEALVTCDFIDWLIQATKKGFRYEVIDHVVAHRRVRPHSLSQLQNYHQVLNGVLFRHLQAQRLT